MNLNTEYALFTGDTVLDEKIYHLSRKNSLFDHELSLLLHNANRVFTNLEAPLTNCLIRNFKVGPNLKSNPEYITALTDNNITDVCLANNHMMDYGCDGLLDTINTCKKHKINYIGHNINLSSEKNFGSFSLNGKKINVVNIGENEFCSYSGCDGVQTFDFIKIIKTLRQANTGSDYTILVFHAGIEYYPLPRPKLRELCHFLIEEKLVNLIICHHTHIASAYEKYNGVNIYYGIGNFLFPKEKQNQSWSHGVIIKVSINNSELVSEVIPYSQDINKHGVKLITGNERESFFAKMKHLNEILINEKLNRQSWIDYCISKKPYYLTLMYFPFTYRPLKFLAKFTFLNFIVNNRFRNSLRMNLIRCESHNEVLSSIHDIEYKKAKK